jgi:hypothetical protein
MSLDEIIVYQSAREEHGEDWYANLLWLSGRKCLLLTHAATLLTVLEADVRAADLRDPGRLGYQPPIELTTKCPRATR